MQNVVILCITWEIFIIINRVNKNPEKKWFKAGRESSSVRGSTSKTTFSPFSSTPTMKVNAEAIGPLSPVVLTPCRVQRAKATDQLQLEWAAYQANTNTACHTAFSLVSPASRESIMDQRQPSRSEFVSRAALLILRLHCEVRVEIRTTGATKIRMLTSVGCN